MSRKKISIRPGEIILYNPPPPEFHLTYKDGIFQSLSEICHISLNQSWPDRMWKTPPVKSVAAHLQGAMEYPE